MAEFPLRYSVWASGRGSNLKALLDAHDQGRLSRAPSLALTDNASAPAMEHARARGVETLFIDPALHKGRKAFGAKAVEELRKRGIEAICLAGFMRIVDAGIIRAFPNRIINIHPSLLPLFPGLDVQKRAIEAGAKESGCTVHFVDEGVDTGPIIMQASVPVLPGDTAETLSARILKEEHRIYPIVVQALIDGRIREESGRVVMTPDAGGGR